MAENEFIDDAEQELIPVSALNQYCYCPRRCALIFIERLWDENVFTIEGRIMHRQVDVAKNESRGDIRIEYGVPLRSLMLGLIGKADAVEFHKKGEKWIPFPVEYKRGKPKPDNSDKVQLCAQAICLEEMLNVEIKNGSLFYGRTRRREDIVFDSELRMATEDIAQKIRELVRTSKTPKAEYGRKCKSCSLLNSCMPKAIGKSKKVERYLMAAVAENISAREG